MSRIKPPVFHVVTAPSQNDVGSTPGDSVPNPFDPFCLRSRELFTFGKNKTETPRIPKTHLSELTGRFFTRLKVKVVFICCLDC